MLYDLVRPILLRLDPERAHHLALGMLARPAFAAALGRALPVVEDPVELWGLEFRNPLGIAAGFDKNCVALRGWFAMGFGFVEIGTVTRHPQSGNDKPRVFRFPAAKALINRLGFPNDGADAIAERLRKHRAKRAFSRFPIGVNIGKSKVTELADAGSDYLYSFERFRELGDFFVVNVSSPNTPMLRELQHPEQLRPILTRLKSAAMERSCEKPILVKIAPDLDDAQIAELVDMLIDCGADGIVATNTTIDHGALDGAEVKGGLSGEPLREKSTRVVRCIHERAGSRLPIIGVGGVSTAADFDEKLAAGATLVEMYTGVVYRGPGVAREILARR